MRRIIADFSAECFSGVPEERHHYASCFREPMSLGRDASNGHEFVVGFGCSGCIVPDSCGLRFYYPNMPGPDCARGARLNSAYPTKYCMPEAFVPYREPKPRKAEGECISGDPMCDGL
jgi:hypothetical protein